MQPYEEENTEDMKNKILARIEELEQEMTNIREGWKQEYRQRTSSLGQETQPSIRTLEDQMAQVAKCGNEEEAPFCVLNSSYSFDVGPCYSCENNSFDSSDDDDEMNFDASSLDLHDVEFETYLDNCLDDALYIHDLIGKDRNEGVEKENVKEDVEKKEKTNKSRKSYLTNIIADDGIGIARVAIGIILAAIAIFMYENGEQWAFIRPTRVDRMVPRAYGQIMTVPEWRGDEASAWPNRYEFIRLN
nr:uncharacterized protein LOC109169483 [Ipomoea batatas]GMD16823.1 uncharacterized protein LOC109169483 [Ipomoea batatas]